MRRPVPLLPILGCLVIIAAFGPGIALSSLTLTDTNPTASQLVSKLLGPGIQVVAGSETSTCVIGQSGIFTDGAADIGIADGILLTSGCADQVSGVNNNDRYKKGNTMVTQGNGQMSCTKMTAGDADLNKLSGKTTYDGCVLTFKFKSESVYGSVYFKFVFASEEYNDYVNTSFNDVFGFILDGENIAFITGTESPVTINNVNLGDYGLGTNAHNSAFFVNNAWMWNATSNSAYNLGRAVEYDGFTTVLIAQKDGLTAGEHTIKLAVADASDRVYDSGVFLQAGSFTSTMAPTVSHIEPKEGGTGTRVTVYGAGFLPEYDYQCLFNGVVSGLYWRQDDKRLVCEASSGNLLGETVAVTVKFRAMGSTSTSSWTAADVEGGVSPAFFYNIQAGVSGTIFTDPNNIESTLRDVGGATVILTLSGATWVSGTTFTDARQSIVNGLTATATQTSGWNKVLRPAIPVDNVVRTSDTVVTITLPAVPGYSIAKDETIKISVPYWANVEGTVLSCGDTITLRGVATAAVGGTVLTEYSSETAVADTSVSKNIQITLDGTTWVGGTDSTRYIFDKVRQYILDGIESSQQESNGFNMVVKPAISVDDVVRTSDTVVTVTLPKETSSGYHITADEEIKVRVPQSAVSQSAAVEVSNSIVVSNVDTFWEVFGVTIIAVSVTTSTVFMAGVGLVFSVAAVHYKLVKNRKKREVLASHQLAEDMARRHEARLEEADREVETVFNPLHGLEEEELEEGTSEGSPAYNPSRRGTAATAATGGRRGTTATTATTGTNKARRESRRLSTLEKAGEGKYSNL